MRSLSPRQPWPWLGVVAMTAIAASLYGPMRGTTAQAQNQQAEKPSGETIARMEAMSDAFKKVAKQVKPAVVQITSKVMSREPARRPGSPGGRNIDPEELPEQFREFFKEFEGRGGAIPTPPRPRTGTGSGFIIDAEKGLIVTNNHVVGGPSEDGEKDDKQDVEVWVNLPDGRRHLKAKVVGVDPLSDIALIQIDAGNLTAVPLGDSVKTEVGDWVLAIGAPFGLDQTVTQGIISATGRRIYNETVPYQDWLQTDAAINPGNSGGPLVNLRGEVVGINVAIATSGLAGGYQGVGFAIPVNSLKQVLPDLREGRDVVRGYLGVSIQGLEAQPGLAETFGLKPDQNGVLVEDVQPRTPAAKAGLRRQDIILSYDGKELKNANELQALVARTKPGTKADMKVWRENKEITIPVTIEKQPSDFFARARNSRGGQGPGAEAGGETEEAIEPLGLTVAELTPELAKKFAIEGETRNQVVVTEVEPMGEAAELGLSPGDVIVSIQDKPIKNAQALKDALSDEALERGLRMQVRTKAGYRTLFLKLSPASK